MLVDSDFHGLFYSAEQDGGNFGIVFDECFVAFFAVGFGKLVGVLAIDVFAMVGGFVEQLVDLVVDFYPHVDKGLHGFEIFVGIGGLFEEGRFGGAFLVVLLQIDLLLVFGEGGEIFELFARETCGEFGLLVCGFGELSGVDVGGRDGEGLHGEVEEFGLEGGDGTDEEFEGLLVEFGLFVVDELLGGG